MMSCTHQKSEKVCSYKGPISLGRMRWFCRFMYDTDLCEDVVPNTIYMLLRLPITARPCVSLEELMLDPEKIF